MDVEERGRVLNIRPRTPIDQNVITPISEEGKNINAIEIPVSIPRVNFSKVKVSGRLSANTGNHKEDDAADC